MNQLQEPAWKQEVNRRVAAHKHGKPATASPGAAEHPTPTAATRAAKAAARVARRFAKAPSYNEMLANEARAAVEAAEVASLAAQQAHVQAQLVLAGIESASDVDAASDTFPDTFPDTFHDPFWQQRTAEVVPFAAVSHQAPAFQSQSHDSSVMESFAIRWEQELPERRPASTNIRATRGTLATHGTSSGHETSLFESATEEWNSAEMETAQPQEIPVIEPAQPIFGNVIEFPRQIVATRKVRPRLAEGPMALPAAGEQLSIFEVDPTEISVEPDVESRATVEQATEWAVPEWSSMRLEPALEPEPQLLDDPEPQPAPAPAIELASMSRRMLAGVVDTALVAGACLAAAALAANNASGTPGLRAIEIGSVVALLVAAAAYKLLFFTLARATPGMKYARLALCTFEGGTPTRAQRYARLAALLLSILPMGLGFAWAIFDDQNLTWHDRISRTYLRVN